ncbi:DUF4238 domain-containing protein [Streptomyces sparsogenes]|uniref:DUF4238 domain-containing protein n=1 Tax=Streptomyces sparsogenes TaxID=67365 RepID=UPI000978DFC4
MPKYWLRAFAEDGHVLGRWRGGAEHRTPVRRAAVAREFNTDPLADGERRVALETYLDRHVDGPCAPVLRALREGRWPLDEVQHALALDALAWQVVRTQAFRSFDEQVGRQLFPALWASEAVGYCEERLGRPLSDAERMEPFRGRRPARGAAHHDPRFRAHPRHPHRPGPSTGGVAPGGAVAGPGRQWSCLAPQRMAASASLPRCCPRRSRSLLRCHRRVCSSPHPARTTARIRGSPAKSPPRPTPGQQPGARTPSTGSRPCPGPPGCGSPAPRWKSGRRG